MQPGSFDRVRIIMFGDQLNPQFKTPRVLRFKGVVDIFVDEQNPSQLKLQIQFIEDCKAATEIYIFDLHFQVKSVLIELSLLVPVASYILNLFTIQLCLKIWAPLSISNIISYIS